VTYRVYPILGLGLVLAFSGCGQADTGSLAADLAINFECNASPSVGAIEKFLEDRQFTFLDAAHVQEQYGIKVFSLKIEGFDAQRRMIDFTGLNIPTVPGRSAYVLYTAVLDSPPPTRHNDNLEKGIESFLVDTLGCKITSKNRGENGADSKKFFDKLYSMQQNRIREGKVCDKGAGTFDFAACREVPGSH
jgi:hypothetical protein